MHRRNFLKGAAALAVAPALAPVAAPAVPLDVATPAARYRACSVWSASGFRVFDGRGVLRLLVGVLDADDPAWNEEVPYLVQYNA